MKLKSLLLGSAAALVAVSGARAADAVVIPEPELVEYVRVCDMYGTGFFYIPGTETCLAISGYVRYEMNFSSLGDATETAGPARYPAAGNAGWNDGKDDWGKRSEVRLNIDARNETELGTLRSYIRLGYDSVPSQDGDNDASGFAIDHAYIQLAGITVGKNASWWDWGFGADADAIVNFGPGEVGMVSYTATAGGFAFTLAAEEDENGNYMPDIVADIDGSIGDFSVRAGLAYNESAVNGAISAKIAAAYDFGAFAVQLGYQYSEANALGNEYLAAFEHVIGGDVSADLTDKLSARAGFNYGLENAANLDGYVIGAGINYALVDGFDIDARVNYANGDAFAEQTTGRIRLTRSF